MKREIKFLGRWSLVVGRLTMVVCFLMLAAGCDAFVRKFTRKPNKDNLPQEEMVLAPEEYKGPQMSNEELYRQYFLFWKSWQDELVNSLEQKASQKKQLDCVIEATKNMLNLRPLLKEEKIKALDAYISELQELQDSLVSDLYSSNSTYNLHKAERLRRNILRDFSYNKVKDSII
jgi:hypothetical protein